MKSEAFRAKILLIKITVCILDLRVNSVIVTIIIVIANYRPIVNYDIGKMMLISDAVSGKTQ